MNNLYAAYEIPKEASTQGAWIDYPGCKIKVSYTGEGNKNTKYKNLMRTRMKPYRRYLEKAEMTPPPDIQDKLDLVFAEVFAASVLLGWEDVRDRDGNLLAFNYENCVKILTDLPVLFDKLRDDTGELVNFQRAQDEEDSKNS